MTANATCVVIPMKAPRDAKQRLRPALLDEDRCELALALFDRTLVFLRQYFPALTVLVVTASTGVARLATQAGAQVLMEQQPQGLNQALRAATAWTLQNGFARQLILPADIGQLQASEVAFLLSRLTGNGVAIAVAKDLGTNALLSQPPNAIEFCFGTDSALQHQVQAQLNNLECHMLHLTHLSQDIDIPEDLPNLERLMYQHIRGVATYVR